MADKTKRVMDLGNGFAAKKSVLKKSKIDVQAVEKGVSTIHPEVEEPTVRISGKFKKSIYQAMKKKTVDQGETITAYIDRLVREDLGL